MDYKKTVEDIVEYFKEGFEREGQGIFNDIDNLKERLNEVYLYTCSDRSFDLVTEGLKKYSLITDHLISSVISEIFGDLYITGEYNFNVVDNALEQLRRRGLITN